MLLTDENAYEVAEWAGGRVERTDRGRVVRLPKTTIPITIGDYAVRDVLPDGLSETRAMRPVVFEWAYQRTIGAPLRHRRKDADD